MENVRLQHFSIFFPCECGQAHLTHERDRGGIVWLTTWAPLQEKWHHPQEAVETVEGNWLWLVCHWTRVLQGQEK